MAASTETQPEITREVVSERHLSQKLHGTATTKKFVQKAMGTVAAVLTAQAVKQVMTTTLTATTATTTALTATTTTLAATTTTLTATASTTSPSQSPDYEPLKNSLIYCGAVTIGVPFLYFFAHWVKNTCKGRSRRCKLVAELWMVSLPMFFAWAFKDVVAELFKIFETSEGQIAITLSLMMSVAVFKLMAAKIVGCFSKGYWCAREVGHHFVILTNNLGLAVGWAVNQVFCWLPNWLSDRFKTTLGFIVVNIVYFLIITLVFCPAALEVWTCLTPPPEKKENERKQKAPFFPPDTEESGIVERVDNKFFPDPVPDDVGCTCKDLIGSFDKLVKSSLSFVYAWASLYTLDAFFFEYLMNCPIDGFGGANDCSYQVYFGFSLGLSVVFSRTAALWSAEHEASGTTKKGPGTQMQEKALPMIVGWEWATFCKRAIKHAQEDHTSKVDKHDQWSPDTFLLLCTFGLWIIVSLMYIAFDAERDNLNNFVKIEARFPGPHALELGKGDKSEPESVEDPGSHAPGPPRAKKLDPWMLATPSYA